jgi:hypothetical protein
MIAAFALIATMPLIEVEVSQTIEIIGKEDLYNLNVRPNVTAETLHMPGVCVAPAPASSISGGLTNAINYCIDGGAPPSIGPVITAELIEVQKGVTGAIYGSARDVNPNLLLRPGGTTARTYGVENVSAGAIINVYGQPGRTLQRSFEIPFGRFYRVPENPLFKETFFPDTDHSDFDSWFKDFGGLKFGAKFEPQMGGYKGLRLPVYYDRIGKRTNNISYGLEYRRQYGAAYCDDLLKRSGADLPWVNTSLNNAAPQGKDMNALLFPGTPQFDRMPDCGSTYDVPVGSIWIPDKDGYQTLVNIERLTYTFPSTSIGGPLLQQRFRTNCLDMKLKEPALGVRYFPFLSSDPVMRNLANISGTSRFRGPWDQARTWIYTDRSSMSEINKRLLPGVTPGLYTQGLFDVNKSGGFGPKDFGNAELFTPNLFAGSTVSENGLAWFTSVMAEHHAKPTRQWMERNPPDLVKLLTGDATDISHAGRLFSNLLMSPSLDARMGALRFLNANPAASLSGKISTPYMSLYSSDPTEVEAALNVAEKLLAEKPTAALRHLAANGKTDAIKKKAAALLGG